MPCGLGAQCPDAFLRFAFSDVAATRRPGDMVLGNAARNMAGASVAERAPSARDRNRSTATFVDVRLAHEERSTSSGEPESWLCARRWRWRCEHFFNVLCGALRRVRSDCNAS